MVRPQIWRQTLVLGGLLCCSISNGYIFGQMSGMLAALHAHEDGTTLTNDEISWIASSLNITSVTGFALAAVLTDKIGRRRSITVFSVPMIISWIFLYFAEEMIAFMVSRILVGVCFGGILSIIIISTPEYTSPNIRGLFLNLMTSVGPGVGTTLGHVFGILYNWRIVALIGIIPTALGGILPIFSEESPSWLASKGKFEACDKAFRRLHGHRNKAEIELQILTEVEKFKLQRIKETDSTAYVFQKLMIAFKKKYFWKILILSFVINTYIAAAGKLLFSTLAITMLEEMTGSKDLLMFTLLVDGFVVLGTILSCVMVKVVNMRTLLLSTGVIANLVLITLSGCMYFHPEKGGYYAWVNCGLLALYFVTVNAGPYPVLEAFIGEIFPLELKAYCFFLSGILLSVLLFLSIKLADNIFYCMGYHGAFLLNAGIMSLCLGYVYMKLPETKGRTLQEIELYFKNDTFDAVDKVLNASSLNITCVVGFAFAAILTEKIGRRKSITVFSVPTIISWLLLYFAEEMIAFMVSRILVGICFGGVLSIIIVSTPEYTSPKIRGLFLNLMTSVGPGFGTALGHVFGILFNWRIVALIGIIPITLGGILPIFSEESPSWLASKGKFEACDKAFRRLNGHRDKAEIELQILTEVEKCKLQRIKETDSTAYVFQKFMIACKKKYFWKIIILSFVINTYVAAAGKLQFSLLALTMLEDMTGSKDLMLFTLLVDGFVILGTILSCVMVKVMNMKTLLFSTGVTANLFLVALSAWMYFQPEKGGYSAWVSCGLYALYFITVNIGPYPMLEAFISEIFPLELKAYCFFLSGIFLSVLMFFSIKLAENIFYSIGYHGAFLLNAVIMSLCLGYLYIMLPETKGRTMQEIEMYFKNNTFNEVEKVLNGEQIKVLI